MKMKLEHALEELETQSSVDGSLRRKWVIIGKIDIVGKKVNCQCTEIDIIGEIG